MKKKRGRGKATSDVSKQEALDSQGEESPKEVVSRSGRKIKPKRFADFSSSDETETNVDKNGIYNVFYCIKTSQRIYYQYFALVTNFIYKINFHTKLDNKIFLLNN